MARSLVRDGKQAVDLGHTPFIILPLKNQKAFPKGHTEDIMESLSFQENKILKMIGAIKK